MGDLDCDCDDFKLSWHQIIAAQMFAHTHGAQYTGATIRFCPWCGKSLLTNQSSEGADSIIL